MTARGAGRVVVPDPAQPPLGLVLTCGAPGCGHRFTPSAWAFTGGRLRCPRCSGWCFTGELAEPDPAGGERR